MLDLFHVVTEDILKTRLEPRQWHTAQWLCDMAFTFEGYDSVHESEIDASFLPSWQAIARQDSTIASIDAGIRDDDRLRDYRTVSQRVCTILTGEATPTVEEAREAFLDMPVGLLRFLVTALARKRVLSPTPPIAAKLSHMLLAASAMHTYTSRLWSEVRMARDGTAQTRDASNPVLSSTLVATSLSVMESIAASIQRDQHVDASQMQLLAFAVSALKRGIYRDEDTSL
jgi:hypothetical protein